jgi:hypothetical protein
MNMQSHWQEEKSVKMIMNFIEITKFFESRIHIDSQHAVLLNVINVHSHSQNEKSCLKCL